MFPDVENEVSEIMEWMRFVDLQSPLNPARRGGEGMAKNGQPAKQAGEARLTRFGAIVGICSVFFTVGTAAGGFAFNSSQNAQLVKANTDLQAKLDKTTAELQAKIDKANAELQSTNAALIKANARADDHAAYEADIARLQAKAEALDKQLTPAALKLVHDTSDQQDVPVAVMATESLMSQRDEVSKELLARMSKCSN